MASITQSTQKMNKGNPGNPGNPAGLNGLAGADCADDVNRAAGGNCTDDVNCAAGLKNLRSLTLLELEAEVKAAGEKAYRARQIYGWLHKKLCACYGDMANVPKSLKAALKEKYSCEGLRVYERQKSALDGTEKYLFGLEDGSAVEAVKMEYEGWVSACISTQVGCAMGCTFCASAIGGFKRDLEAGEMLNEVYQIQREMEGRLSHVVLMGTGEPLENFTQVCRFIDMLASPDGLNIGQRNITLSTCGIVPAIYELAKRHYEINLAISLHAPDDEKRRALMPVARRWSIEELMEACRYYFRETGRRITFEYSLMSGVNDSERDADRLSGWLKGMKTFVF